MLYLLFASFFYVFFNGISDPLVADCLDTKSKQKSQDWIFSLKNYNYFNKIPKLTPFGRRTASGFGRKANRFCEHNFMPPLEQWGFYPGLVEGLDEK